MTTLPSHEDIQQLLGAYALDALEPDEIAAVEAHLASCAICRDELRSFTEVAALLGTADGEPPPEIWKHIAGQLGAAAVTPLPPPPAPRVTPTRRWAMLAAAAVIVLIAGLAGLAVVAVRQQHQLDHANQALAANASQRSVEQAALAAAAAPGARQVALVDSRGTKVATVVLTSSSTAYLIPTSLPGLSPSRTYQLWGVHDTTAISLAVLGSSPTVTPITVPANLQALAVTDEVSPGVVVSKNPPVAKARLT